MRLQAAAPWWQAPALMSLGQVSSAQGDFLTARAALWEGISIALKIGDIPSVAAGILTAAFLASRRGKT